MEKKFKNKFPSESAGQRMIKNVPLAYPHQLLSEVRNMLFEKMKELETINYIYVIEEDGKLVGVFSIKEVFRRPENTRVAEIMEKQIVKARPRTDQERVVILALKNKLKAIPVVDKNDRFLGIIPSDIILNILHQEDVEDFLHFGGIERDTYSPAGLIGAPARILVKVRLPWLLLGLFGGLFAAQIVGFFEASLRANFILAAFIPLIVYMADAVGTQAEILFIRSLTLNSKLNTPKYLLKEVKVSLLIALALGLSLSLFSSIWFGSPNIGIILGISLFITVIVAILTGVLVPWLLKSMKKDPAIGSGPFGTIVRDILSLIIYFSVASLMLKLI